MSGNLRPVYLPPDPASRTAYLAGGVAQCDFWFPDIELPVGFGQTRTAKRLPVLTMVCGYCRWLSARLVPSRTAEDLFAGWWALIAQLGAVPRLLVWDGEAAVGRWRRGVSDPTHVEAAKAMRHERLSVVSSAAAAQPLVEQRVLSDYDTVFGLSEGAQ